MGIASGVPVAVTPLPTFDDLEDAVFRLPGIDPQSVAIGLEQILNNEKAVLEIKAKAAQWSDERLIPRVSKKFFHLISS
jgi:hypothetical protein